MATKKITELPLIQTISGSYSVVPIVIGNVVGSGTTDQITIENFSRFVTAYSAHTGSAGNTFTGPQTINNNVTINGKLTVTELVATYETASIIYSEGGNIFGNELIDKQQFTGSSNFTGSVFINGQDYTIYSSSNSTVFTNFSSSNSTVFTNFSSSNSTVFTNFSSSNSSYNTTFSSSNAAYVTALSSSNSNYNTIFSSSNSSYNTIFSSSNSTTITTLLAGTNSELARVYQTTASIQAQTASLLQFTASQDGRNFIISQYTSSTDAHIVGISDFTSSQLAVNLGNSIYTASVDSHIVGISTYTSSVRDTLSRVYQATQSLQLATASIQIQTASLLAFTASQDSRNFTLSQVTGSLIGITNGLMAFTAALDNTYATDAQLYQLYQATRSLELHSGSMVGITNELMALTASMKGQAIVSSSTQISNYYKFAETASANTTFYGGINVTDYSKFGKTGVAKALDVFGGISVTGSVITQQNSIGSFVGSYYTQWDSFGSQGGDGNASVGYFVGAFNDDRKLRLLSDADILLTHGINKKIQVAKASVGTSKVEITGSFNVTGSSALVGNAEINGGITVTEYSKFGKSGLAKAVDFSNAIAVTGSITTQANSIGGFVGSYYTQWDSFGSQGGDGNASVGYFVGTFNDDRKLRLLSDSDILLTTGINKKIQVAKASVGTSKVEITGSFNVTGSSTTVGNFEVLNGSIVGSVLATNGVVSSSTQVQNYDVFALNSNLYTTTGSLIGITNGLMAFTAALDSTYATDAQLYQLYQATQSLELLSGSLIGITNGLMAFTAALDSTYATDAQLYQLYAETASMKAEIAGIEAYTASLKGVAIVSSSQQIQNYFTFAQTSSANIFYDYQAISGSKFELHTSDANGGIVVNSKATTSQTFMTFLDRGTNDNSTVGTFVNVNGTNQLGGLAIVGHRKDNQSGLVLRGQNKVANSNAVNGYITAVIGNAYSDNALTTLTTGVTGKSISFLGQDTELANLNFNGDLTITNGNLVVASGKGIDFSATSNGSGTTSSELLNDYEEGTWTGTMIGTVTNPTTPVTATGTYTKIGRQVTAQIAFVAVDTTGAAGGVRVTGLPFATSGLYVGSVILEFFDFTAGRTSAACYTNNGTPTTIFIEASGDDTSFGGVAHTAGTGRYLYATLTYFV